MSSGKFFGGRFADFGHETGMTIRSAVRTGQIITFALAKGVIFFAAIAIFLSLGNNGWPDATARPDAAAQPDAAVAPGDVIGGKDLSGVNANASTDALLPWIGVAAFAVAVIAGVVAPAVMRSRAVHNFQQTGQRLPISIDAETPLTDETGQLVSRLMAATLVGQAIFEGAGVINLVLLIMTNQIFLLVPAVVAVFAIVIQCPTKSTVLDRLESLARA